MKKRIVDIMSSVPPLREYDEEGQLIFVTEDGLLWELNVVTEPGHDSQLKLEPFLASDAAMDFVHERLKRK